MEPLLLIDAYTREGTCAHEVADKALTEGKDCKEYIGQVYEGFTVTEEMAEYVQTYVDYVLNEADGELKDLLVEEKFRLGMIRDDMYGTNDACVAEVGGTLTVIDLKYGKGKEVFAENNTQLMYYALGAIQGGDYQEVKMVIVQPRIENPLKEWTVPVKVIEDFEETLRNGVLACEEENPVLNTGDHCFFCPAKAICPQQKEEIMAVTKSDFSAVPVEEFMLPEASSLTPAMIGNILDNKKKIEEWLKSVGEYAFFQAEKGVKIDGYKLVAAKANRFIGDTASFEADHVELFGEELYNKKLKGIGELTKLVGKKDIEPYLIKPDKGNSLAPISDKRKEVQPSVITAFEAVPLEELETETYDNMDF